MQISSENGIIRLMRGDTLTTPIRVNIGTAMNPVYKKLDSNDNIYFALMEPNQAFEDAVLKKRYDWTSDTDSEGNVLLKLDSQDTQQLLVGKYYYMIKFRSVDEFGQEVVKTIVPPTLFWLEGNNPHQEETPYWKKGKYDIDEVVFEGGQIEDDHIVYEGGEIV